jgi:hypothetical protein
VRRTGSILRLASDGKVSGLEHDSFTMSGIVPSSIPPAIDGTGGIFHQQRDSLTAANAG